MQMSYLVNNPNKYHDLRVKQFIKEHPMTLFDILNNSSKVNKLWEMSDQDAREHFIIQKIVQSQTQTIMLESLNKHIKII